MTWKMPNKGLEFDGLKNKGQIVKKIWQSVDVGISDDQQQQTESMPSSTDTTLAVKSVISADNWYCYTDLSIIGIVLTLLKV